MNINSSLLQGLPAKTTISQQCVTNHKKLRCVMGKHNCTKRRQAASINIKTINNQINALVYVS